MVAGRDYLRNRAGLRTSPQMTNGPSRTVQAAIFFFHRGSLLIENYPAYIR